MFFLRINKSDIIMEAIISKATLSITTQTAKGNPFYGNITSKKTFVDEYVMDKFKGVSHPNSGLEVGFQFGKSTYIIQANKYAFTDQKDGIYSLLISSNEYVFELSIETDEEENILAKDVNVSIYDNDDIDECITECVKIDNIKILK